MAKRCIPLLMTMHVFSDFYYPHTSGLEAITEFVSHCVNYVVLVMSPCAFFCVHGAVIVVVRTA